VTRRRNGTIQGLGSWRGEQRVLFNPFTVVFLVLFFGLFLFVLVFVKIGAITIAFTKIGISPEHMLTLLFLTLLGSAFNVPIKKFEDEDLCEERTVRFSGIRYRLPLPRRPCTTLLAVNVGGAVIPTLLSLYVLFNSEVPVRAVLATAIVSVVVYKLARPIKGIGIGVPLLLPPVLAAVVALILAPHNSPEVAYVGGTMGTLIGADLLNLDKIRGLGAPVASIGGAGTFDGVFLTGIIAVLLA
jgi:uncharacterized membrane protein